MWLPDVKRVQWHAEETATWEESHWNFFIKFENRAFGQAVMALICHMSEYDGASWQSSSQRRTVSMKSCKARQWWHGYHRMGCLPKNHWQIVATWWPYFSFSGDAILSVQSRALRRAAHDHCDQGPRSGTWLKIVVLQFLKLLTDACQCRYF